MSRVESISRKWEMPIFWMNARSVAAETVVGGQFRHAASNEIDESNVRVVFVGWGSRKVVQ